MSLAVVGCVGSFAFGDIHGPTNSGARLRENRSTLVLSSTVQFSEWERLYAFPRPAILGVPTASTRTLVYGVVRKLTT